jgi:predicted nucleic acid-binding protein
MGLTAKRIYLDACIVIYHIQRHPEYAPGIRRLLGAEDQQLVCSDLIRLECRVMPVRNRDTALLEAFDGFFSIQELIWAALDTQVFDRATELRADHGLKTPDAIHLAAAIESGCEEFWTNDHRIEKAAGERIRVLSIKDNV